MRRFQKIEILRDFSDYVLSHDCEDVVNDTIGCKNTIDKWFIKANRYREAMIDGHVSIESFPQFLRDSSHLLDAKIFLLKFFNV